MVSTTEKMLHHTSFLLYTVQW